LNSPVTPSFFIYKHWGVDPLSAIWDSENINMMLPGNSG